MWMSLMTTVLDVFRSPDEASDSPQSGVTHHQPSTSLPLGGSTDGLEPPDGSIGIGAFDAHVHSHSARRICLKCRSGVSPIPIARTPVSRRDPQAGGR